MILAINGSASARRMRIRYRDSGGYRDDPCSRAGALSGIAVGRPVLSADRCEELG